MFVSLIRVALSRGINVGGKNIIKMADLRTCLEDAGLHEVSTFIQSGNVLFESKAKRAAVAARIEAALSSTFGYTGSVVLRSRRQMLSVIERAPRGFGERPGEYMTVRNWNTTTKLVELMG